MAENLTVHTKDLDFEFEKYACGVLFFFFYILFYLKS